MFQIIQQDIIYFIKKYLGQGFVFATVCMMIFAIVFFIYRKKCGDLKTLLKRNWTYKGILLYFFFVYIYLVLGITFFSREKTEIVTVDLKLFHTFAKSHIAKRYIYENILMFLPFGIFVYLLSEKFRKIHVTAFLGGMCSFLIEITQYVTHLGKFQVDDIFNNVMGMIIGFGCGWFIYFVANKSQKKI